MVDDQPRLIGLDELDELLRGSLEVLELPVADLKRVDEDDRLRRGASFPRSAG